MKFTTIVSPDYQTLPQKLFYKLRRKNMLPPLHSWNDMPAIEYSDGTKLWYKNGKCHREDGSAIEWFNGFKWWYLDGKRVYNLISKKEKKNGRSF